MKLDPRIKLRHLTCFHEIATAGSLQGAAGNLGMSQPAASKSLRELEQALGRQLFDRSGRRLRLNEAGQVFQRWVGSALADLVRGERLVRGASQAATRLAAGALPTAATALMPLASLAFRARNPACSLRVSTGPNWLLLSQLREGSLDLVVGRMGEPEMMNGLSFEQLYSEDVVAAVRPGHPLTGRPDPAELLQLPLILPPRGAVIHGLVRRYLASIGAPVAAPAFESVSLAFGRKVLAHSDAVWFISRGVVAEELAAGSLRALPLETPMMAGPVGISLRESAPQSADLRRLIACLRETAAGPGLHAPES